MDTFIARHRSAVTGVLSGFDRLVFRGTLMPLARPNAMGVFLSRAGLRLLDFKDFVSRTSERIKEASLAQARRLGRPQRYLESSALSKEDIARRLLAEHPVDRGLVCVLSAVEPCMSFEYHRSPDPQERGLKLRPRKCLHLYHYAIHPQFGFMNARIQTWFPFKVQICLNGREWLARQLTRKHIDFLRADNCFPRLAHPDRAQRCMDQQLETDWPRALNAIARALNPLHHEIFRPWPMDYYWTAYQTEWAADVMFATPRVLANVYPALVRHAMQHFQSPDVMRFLGRKANGHFVGELVTSFKDRPEGVRVKHWVRGNSIKMYDKAGSVLRVETTLAETGDFKVLRPPDDRPDAKPVWKRMRKGVADLHRRAQLSQSSNERYLEALAAVDDTTPCAHLFDAVARPVIDAGRRFRALRIGDPEDLALLQVLSRGEFATAGFRNRDVRSRLHPASARASKDEIRRLAGRVGRRIRLLRAHGIARKIPKTHRYVLTKRGQLLTAALFAAREAPLNRLIATAA